MLALRTRAVAKAEKVKLDVFPNNLEAVGSGVA